MDMAWTLARIRNISRSSAVTDWQAEVCEQDIEHFLLCFGASVSGRLFHTPRKIPSKGIRAVSAS